MLPSVLPLVGILTAGAELEDEAGAFDARKRDFVCTLSFDHAYPALRDPFD
jgi:hypothetical protein